MKILDVSGISKKYGSRQVVRDFSMHIDKGEVVGLLGPNGSGKTTSFYMIIGIVNADSGNVIFNDVDVTKFPMYLRARLGMGYLPQEESVFKKMTVEENIMCALEITYQDKQKRESELNRLLGDFHITHIAKSKASVLSGGERRRLEVARLLAINPSLVLFDEPFAGVDPIAINDIKTIIKGLKNNGISVLITDHNVLEAIDIVDRAYVIYNGQTVCSGTPHEVIHNQTVKDVYLGESMTKGFITNLLKKK